MFYLVEIGGTKTGDDWTVNILKDGKCTSTECVSKLHPSSANRTWSSEGPWDRFLKPLHLEET